MAWTDETWGYVDLGVPKYRSLWNYREACEQKGLSDEAGLVALAITGLFPREFPVKKLIGWCGHSKVRFLKALKELEDAGWLKVTARKWRQMRNLKLE